MAHECGVVHAVLPAMSCVGQCCLCHPVNNPFSLVYCCPAIALQKFRVNFLDVSCGSTFHRCVYILVAKEAAIMQAGQLARQEFQMEGDYMPHVSLLYADLSPEATHQSQQAAVQRLYGEGSDYSTLLTDAGFTADAITVWYTPPEDKSLASWTKLAELQLQG